MNTEAGSTKGFFGGLFLTIVSGLLLVAAAWWLLTILGEHPIALLVLSLAGLVSIFAYVGFVFFGTLRTERIQDDDKGSSPGGPESQDSGTATQGGESRSEVSTTQPVEKSRDEVNKMELVEEDRGGLDKTALMEEIASKAHSSKSDAQRFFDAFTEVVTDSLKNGEQVQITGFGKFYVQERDAKQDINPVTKQRINIPSTKVPKFTAGNALKRRIK